LLTIGCSRSQYKPGSTASFALVQFVVRLLDSRITESQQANENCDLGQWQLMAKWYIWQSGIVVLKEVVHEFQESYVVLISCPSHICCDAVITSNDAAMSKRTLLGRIGSVSAML
jgi:hypothetical protein